MRAQKNIPDQLKLSDFEDKSLLILDDDDPLRGRLARAMEKKGFQVKEAKTVVEGLSIVKANPPGFACVDLRLEDGNGLDVVKELAKNKKESRIVMLTGYYIAKPVDADDVESALLASPESKAKPPENPMSADRVKWEHIHRVFELCNRNVSETARRLKMHRRTLQRILSKRSPR
jgi:two-component system response regulator RegA